jgi:hypothetical protein
VDGIVDVANDTSTFSGRLNSLSNPTPRRGSPCTTPARASFPVQYTGNIDGVRIWLRPLPAAEIAAFYNATAQLCP